MNWRLTRKICRKTTSSRCWRVVLIPVLVQLYANSSCNTYTVTFSNERKEEATNARLLANYFGTEEIELSYNNHIDFEKIIEKLDEPIVLVNYPNLFNY